MAVGSTAVTATGVVVGEGTGVSVGRGVASCTEDGKDVGVQIGGRATVGGAAEGLGVQPVRRTDTASTLESHLVRRELDADMVPPMVEHRGPIAGCSVFILGQSGRRGGRPMRHFTLGHSMLPILHFRPHYASNGWWGGALGVGFLREIWRPWPRYASNPGQIMG
jgi:hypothetical protein